MNIRTYTKFFVGFDRHAPYHDKHVDKIVLDFLADFKPKIRVAGGDWMTVDQVSHFDNESTISLEKEFRMNREAIKKFGITHYLEGNHEERLRRIGMNVDQRLRSLMDLQVHLKLEKSNIPLIPYHPRKGVLKFGHLKILHGFYATEYTAKKMASIYGTCIFGHTHRFQTFQSKDAYESHCGFNIGMMGKIDQPYTESRAPLGWCRGFCFGYIHRNGYFDLYPVRIWRFRLQQPLNQEHQPLLSHPLSLSKNPIRVFS